MITAVMVTVDRSPKKNYLFETLDNLGRCGMWDSPFLHEFHLVDSGGGSRGWPSVILRDKGRDFVHVPEERRCANLNVAEALRIGAESGAEWVMFLEDDIDVCGDFMGSVARWLMDHSRPDRHVYSLGANYPQVMSMMERGVFYWEYPITHFYGTQGFVVRLSAALSLSEFLAADPYRKNRDGSAYDLMMHHWAKDEWPEIEHFLATAPAFVQHTGMDSVINPRGNVHTFPTFPGHGWRYEGEGAG